MCLNVPFEVFSSIHNHPGKRALSGLDLGRYPNQLIRSISIVSCTLYSLPSCLDRTRVKDTRYSSRATFSDQHRDMHRLGCLLVIMCHSVDEKLRSSMRAGLVAEIA
jgi:hypothetical protein